MLEDYEAAMNSRNFRFIVGAMPPALNARFVELSGMDEAQVVETLAGQMDAIIPSLGEIKVTFSFDLDRAEFGESPTGRPYALVPTVTAGPSTILPGIEATSLAFSDHGEWYVVRIESAMHRQLLDDTYPDLAGIVILEPRAYVPKESD